MTTESLFDTHAHVLSADTARYPPSDEGRHGAAPPYTVEQLLADMDTCGVPHACAVQRFHHYFTDNRYVLDAARSSAARRRSHHSSAVGAVSGLISKNHQRVMRGGAAESRSKTNECPPGSFQTRS